MKASLAPFACVFSASKLRALLTAAGLGAGAAAAIATPSGLAAPAQGGVQQLQTAPAGVATRYGEMPIRFEPNVGQADPAVKFVAHGGGYRVGLTENGALLGLSPTSDKSRASKGTSFLRIDPVGANRHPALHGEQAQQSVSNYFIGNDRTKWRSNVANYGAVRYENVYPGVDWVVYGNPTKLEYDLVVAPKADAHQIRFNVLGADSLALDEQGDLLIRTGGWTLEQLKPVVYQVAADGSRLSVEARYLIDRASFSFVVGNYDHERALVIDPSFVYSSYLGGSGFDAGFAIAADSSGNTYVAGQTSSSNFPVVVPFQQTDKTSLTAFVAKLNPAGTALLYSTYIGGSGTDQALGISVDSSGNAYVAGTTSSSDFPTVSPLQGTYGGGSGDGFVAKLNPAGSALVYSTYLGGSGQDVINGIAVDIHGGAYVTGTTASTDFPVSSNPLMATNGKAGSGNTAFVAKINQAGDALSYSTYLGGNGLDQGTAVAVDINGDAYVAGTTTSTNFPTQHPLQNHNAGDGDAFVVKFNEGGGALVYSTYLGGSGQDVANGLAIDGSGNAYVVGDTGSTDFPLSASPFQGTNSGTPNGFVAKINAAGSALVYSTYLGGSSSNFAKGVAVNGAGEAYVVGSTDSSDFPLASPLQSSTFGKQTGFVSKLNASGSALLYSTYLGSTNGNGDSANAVTVDSINNAYVTGSTAGANFLTVSPRQGFGGGSADAFVSKISDGAVAPPTGLTASVGNGQIGLSWAAANGAISYSVFEGTSAGGESTTPIMSGLTTTSFTVPSLSNGTKYFFVVKAVDNSATSDASNEASAVPTAPPSVPYGLSANPDLVNGEFTLCWNQPPDNVTNNVYGVPNINSGARFLVKRGVAGGCTVLSGLTLNTNYYYLVTGVNAEGESHASPVLTVNLPPLPTVVPPAITGLSATTSNGLVDLCWLRNSSAFSYRIYGVSGPGGGNPTLLSTVRNGGCAIINGLTNGTKYFFRVSGVNQIGEGPLSLVVSNTPKPLAAPYGLSITPGTANGQGTLCWNRTTDSPRFNVYQVANSSGSSPVLFQGGIAGGCTVISGLNVSTNYFFEVTGTKLGSESSPSAVLTVNLPPVPTATPASITGISATSGSKQIDVCWLQNKSAYSYHVYSVTGSAGGSPTLIRSVNAPGGCAVITGLTAGTKYFFEVTGVNQIGEGSPSTVVSGVPKP